MPDEPPAAPGVTRGDPRVVEAVNAARAGDNDAFGLLYDTYSRSVARYMRVRLWNPDTADEVAHDAWVKAMESIDQFQWRGHAWSSWMFRVVHSTLTDHQRGLLRRTGRDYLLGAPDIAPDELCHVDRLDAVKRLLAELPAQYRDVLILTYMCDLQVTNVAETLRKTEPATRVLQHRAKKALAVVAERKGLESHDLLG